MYRFLTNRNVTNLMKQKTKHTDESEWCQVNVSKDLRRELYQRKAMSGPNTTYTDVIRSLMDDADD